MDDYQNVIDGLQVQIDEAFDEKASLIAFFYSEFGQ